MQFNFKAIFDILKRSLREAFYWSFWKWLAFGSVGALSGLLKIGKDFFNLDVKSSVTYGLYTLAGIYLARFLLLFFINSLKYYHEVYQNSLYGDALIILKDSFAQAHAYRKTPGHRDTEFMTAMLLFCNNLKIIFDSLTKGDCSVSIKVPLEDDRVDEKTVLVNLTRDISHGSRDTKEYMATKHTLIGNTAFSYTLNRVLQRQKEKYYVNLDVNATKDYLNTSKSLHPDGLLSYESEIVHPIIPIINHDNKNFNCLGFICVDCNKKNAFTSKYHVGIIEGVADGLYDIISQRHKK